MAQDQRAFDNVLGPNTYIFDTTMEMSEIQRVIDSIAMPMCRRSAHFSEKRYALMFMPGEYDLDVQVGYFMHVIGLGASPENVVIKGAVRSNSFYPTGNVLINFWRGMENLTIVPAHKNTNVWGVSQAAPMRRVHVAGNLKIHDNHYVSGGFIADSKVDGIIDAGGGQQWYTRNSEIGGWEGGSWNMFFQGVHGDPGENWPELPYTRINVTDVIREKPYLVADSTGIHVRLPGLRRNATGSDWSGTDSIIPLDNFYIAFPHEATPESINNALSAGKHVLFTPGIYDIDSPIRITRPGTVVLGFGLANLIARNGSSVINVDDVDGVTIAGLLIDAALEPSDVLIEIGPPGAGQDHRDDPTFLFDVFVRVGGPFAGSARQCLMINSNDVVIDHTWLWRADHGQGVGWDINRSANGLTVNGDRVTAYGLFCEHFQEYQTLWNGEGGKVYFFQCEMPYDPPAIDTWKHGDTYGYAGYKVSDNVKVHDAHGVGIYNVFYDAHIVVDQAIECPPALEENFHHVITYWLNGKEESVVKSIINGKGDAVNINNRKATW